jgi:hypothetical protein
MTTHELIIGKTLALGGVITSSLGTALVQAQGTPSVPLEWAGIIALIGAAIGYGRLSGRLEERQRADDQRFARLAMSQQYVQAAVTRIAENQGVPLSDLQAQFQSEEA